MKIILSLLISRSIIYYEIYVTKYFFNFLVSIKKRSVRSIANIGLIIAAIRNIFDMKDSLKNSIFYKFTLLNYKFFYLQIIL